MTREKLANLLAYSLIITMERTGPTSAINDVIKIKLLRIPFKKFINLKVAGMVPRWIQLIKNRPADEEWK